jgi:hypothetical protein
MKTYSQRDAAITSFVDVIELISLNFDRGYYSMIAALFEIERAILSECDKSKSGKLLAEQHRTEHELRGFIGGLQLFSDRIGISLDRLLSFSIANDQKFLNKRLKERKTLYEEDAILAETICTMIEDMWKRRAPYTAFNVAAATD